MVSNGTLLFLAVLGGLAFPFLTFAAEESVFLEREMEVENQIADRLQRLAIPPGLAFERTQRVLRSFGVPAEPNYQTELNLVKFESPSVDRSRYVKVLDPQGQFRRFFSLSVNELLGFADRDLRTVSEHRVSVRGHLHGSEFTNEARPLRVALDPGHMGGDLWDKRTGKYVREGQNKVSEGIIALQTALLMERELKAMGIEVMITRRSLVPVTAMKYEDLKVSEFGKRELRMRSLASWFQALIESSSESNLESNFRNSSAVKKIFSEVARSDYFAMREDLLARERKIKEFAPDVIVIIHFDADQENPNPKVSNRTRSYVPGAFALDEFATAESRARFMHHYAKMDLWNRSVRLSHLITKQISQELKVPMPESDVKGSVRVAPGVFARNLALTRVLTEAPLSFQECLYYGNPEEFRRLLKKDGGELIIDGQAMPYSLRLKQLASAMTRGVSNYLAEFH